MTQKLCNTYLNNENETVSSTNNNPSDEVSDMLNLVLTMSNYDKPKETQDKEQEKNEPKQKQEEQDIPYWSEEEYAIIKVFYENEREYEQEDKEILERYLLEHHKK